MPPHKRSPVGKTVDWITPPWIVGALGTFDLDPCASSTQPWEMAKKSYTIEDDGLTKKWEGRVFLNPPYGSSKILTPWLKKLSEHGEGTTLIFARTETETFFRYCWGEATAMLFLKKRLHFYRSDGTRKKGGNAGAPSVLIAYGEKDANLLFRSKIPGSFVRNWKLCLV